MTSFTVNLCQERDLLLSPGRLMLMFGTSCYLLLLILTCIYSIFTNSKISKGSLRYVYLLFKLCLSAPAVLCNSDSPASGGGTVVSARWQRRQTLQRETVRQHHALRWRPQRSLWLWNWFRHTLWLESSELRDSPVRKILWWRRQQFVVWEEVRKMCQTDPDRWDFEIAPLFFTVVVVVTCLLLIIL